MPKTPESGCVPHYKTRLKEGCTQEGHMNHKEKRGQSQNVSGKRSLNHKI